MFLPLFRRMKRNALRIVAKKGGKKEIATNRLGQRTLWADDAIERMVADEIRKERISAALLGEERGMVELAKKPKWLFVCDPLDGSENFKRDIPVYAIGIAAASGRRLRDVEEAYVANLVSGEEFYSRKGKGVWRDGRKMDGSGKGELATSVIALDYYEYRRGMKLSYLLPHKLLADIHDYRRFGPDLIDMALTACGGIDAFVHPQDTLSIVHASGLALLNESCVTTDIRGKGLGETKLDEHAKVSVLASGSAKLHADLAKWFTAER